MLHCLLEALPTEVTIEAIIHIIMPSFEHVFGVHSVCQQELGKYIDLHRASRFPDPFEGLIRFNITEVVFVISCCRVDGTLAASPFIFSVHIWHG